MVLVLHGNSKTDVLTMPTTAVDVRVIHRTGLVSQGSRPLLLDTTKSEPVYMQ
jgi:hypothetical protein